MTWHARTLAALATCSAAHFALLSCNGAAFSEAPASADAGSGGAGGKASGSGGKASAGSGQGGKAGPGGSPSGGSPAGGTTVSAGSGGATNAGASGVGGAPPRPPLPAEGLLYWFAGDLGVEKVEGGVATWKDQSGNGFNAVQLLPELRPTLSTSDLLPLPFLNFDGADDYMELPELTTTLAGGLSLFVVAGSATADTCSAFVELSNGSEISDVHFGAHQGVLQYEVDQAVLTGLAGTFPAGGVRLVEVHQSVEGDQTQGPVELRLNGTQAGSTVMQLPADVSRISNFLGRTLYANCVTFGGAMGELILYSRKVTADERALIDSYLTEKWQCCK